MRTLKSIGCMRVSVLFAAVTILSDARLCSAAMAQEEKAIEGFPAVLQRDITLWSDSTRLSGVLLYPKDREDGKKLPAIVLCNGWGGTKAFLMRTGIAPRFAAAGCDRPTLLADLRASDSYLVHGLDRDPARVAMARTYLREEGLYGSVTAGGRTFYIIDEGPISSVFLPPQWKLVARDAVSGVLLWQRPITSWESRLRGFRSGPPEIMPTTMAVDDGRICLQSVSHVVCLDGIRGQELWRSERAAARSRFSCSTPPLVIQDGVMLSLDRAAGDNVDKSPPPLSGGLCLFGTRNGFVYCLRTKADE